MTLIYKIATEGEWREAVSRGAYHGSAADRRDGFIHLSAAQQLAETAASHFAGQADLVLVAFEAEDFGAELRWEPSRGGDLFPHVYGALPANKARWVRPLPLEVGGHRLPPNVDL